MLTEILHLHISADLVQISEKLGKVDKELNRSLQIFLSKPTGLGVPEVL